MATVKNYVSIDFWKTDTHIDRDWQVEMLGDVCHIVKIPHPTICAQGSLLLKLVSSAHSSILILTCGLHISLQESWNWLVTYITADLRYYDNILFYKLKWHFLTIIIYSQGRGIILVQCMEFQLHYWQQKQNSNFTCFWKTWLENPTLLHWHDEWFPLLCVTEFKLHALEGEWHIGKDNNTSVIPCGQFFGFLLLQHAVFFCEDQECTSLHSRPACSERSFKSLSWLWSFSKISWMMLQQRLPLKNPDRKSHWSHSLSWRTPFQCSHMCNIAGIAALDPSNSDLGQMDCPLAWPWTCLVSVDFPSDCWPLNLEIVSDCGLIWK